jgi:pyruvate/2-oxoacid:ferredoxin oxidoreductase alpha subunit
VSLLLLLLLLCLPVNKPTTYTKHQNQKKHVHTHSTSHEVNTIDALAPDAIKPLFDGLAADIAGHRARALNPAHPHQRGTSEAPDVYMQMAERSNAFYDAVPGIVQQAMDDVAAVTGRPYRLFEYVGAPDAEHVVVVMGSGASVCEEAAAYLNAQSGGGPKVREGVCVVYGFLRVLQVAFAT